MFMQSQNRFFEDFSKVVTGAVGTLAGVGREAEGALRERFREFMGGFDFVSRDEFDAVKAMAAAARDDGEELKARLEADRKSVEEGKNVSVRVDLDGLSIHTTKQIHHL